MKSSCWALFSCLPHTDTIFEMFTQSRDRQRQTDHLDSPVARRRMCVIMSRTDHRMMECRRSGNNDRRVASLCRVASLRVCPLTSLSCTFSPYPPPTPPGVDGSWRVCVWSRHLHSVLTYIFYNLRSCSLFSRNTVLRRRRRRRARKHHSFQL